MRLLLSATAVLAAGLVHLAARADEGGDPWAVRVNPVARGNRLLKLLDESPDSDDGLKALIASVGLQRALGLAGARSASQRSWQARYVEGRLWAMRGQLARAEAAFDGALAVGRKAPRLLGWIGEELIRAGQVKRAEAMLKRWQPRRPDDADALALLSRIALSRRDVAAALKAQRRLAELQPSNVQVRLVHARLQRESGAIDAAAKEIEAALALQRKEKEADAALECQMLLEHGALLELLERFDDAVKGYRRGLTLTAEGRWAYRELQQRILRSFERRGAFVELEREARAILKRSPKNLLALRTLAERSQKTGKHADAIGFYLRYIKGAPGDSSARGELLFLLTRAGRHKEAVEHARELHQRNPSLARNLLEYASTLGAAGQRQHAVRALRDGIKRYAKDVDGLQLMASGLDSFGDSEGVRLAFAALLKLDGPDREQTRAYGSYLWGKGRHADAVKTWGALVGATASRLDYERWVEVMLEENVVRERSLRSHLVEEVKRGLARHPGHRGLQSLGRQVGL